MLNDTYQDVLTSDERATEVAKEILEKGHIELKDFLSPEAWQQLADFAAKQRENAISGFRGGKRLGNGEDLKRIPVQRRACGSEDGSHALSL